MWPPFRAAFLPLSTRQNVHAPLPFYPRVHLHIVRRTAPLPRVPATMHARVATLRRANFETGLRCANNRVLTAGTRDERARGGGEKNPESLVKRGGGRVRERVGGTPAGISGRIMRTNANSRSAGRERLFVTRSRMYTARDSRGQYGYPHSPICVKAASHFLKN